MPLVCTEFSDRHSCCRNTHVLPVWKTDSVSIKEIIFIAERNSHCCFKGGHTNFITNKSANWQILELIPLSQIRKFLRCVSPQISQKMGLQILRNLECLRTARLCIVYIFQSKKSCLCHVTGSSFGRFNKNSAIYVITTNLKKISFDRKIL